MLEEMAEIGVDLMRALKRRAEVEADAGAFGSIESAAASHRINGD
jgi:hypothetical protein